MKLKYILACVVIICLFVLLGVIAGTLVPENRLPVILLASIGGGACVGLFSYYV